MRAQRRRQGRRLIDVAEDAGVSPQYLSELERGLKDPSSELIEAVAGALGYSVLSLVEQIVHETRASEHPQTSSGVHTLAQSSRQVSPGVMLMAA
nr:helix-turn-helix transcriptional regulator [Devriesea agamarum]